MVTVTIDTIAQSALAVAYLALAVAMVWAACRPRRSLEWVGAIPWVWRSLLFAGIALALLWVAITFLFNAWAGVLISRLQDLVQ